MRVSDESRRDADFAVSGHFLRGGPASSRTIGLREFDMEMNVKLGCKLCIESSIMQGSEDW